jgi:hypothetical protein
LTVLFYILVILMIAAPIAAIDLLRARSAWIEENHGWLQLVAWLVTLFLAIYWFHSSL